MSVQAAVRTRVWIWPAIVLGLFVVQGVFMALAIVLAHADPSVAVEPGYDDKALRWDEGVARRRAADERGWALNIEVDANRVRVLVTERGAPARAMEVSVEAFHHAASGDRAVARAIEVAPGEYAADVALARPGWWEVRARATRPDAGEAEALVVRTVFVPDGSGGVGGREANGP